MLPHHPFTVPVLYRCEVFVCQRNCNEATVDVLVVGGRQRERLHPFTPLRMQVLNTVDGDAWILRVVTTDDVDLVTYAK